MKRVVTNEDIVKYDAMVVKYLRDSVIKNWNEATLNRKEDEITLGNTGWSMADMRQYLYTELIVALQNYNPEYRNKQGKLLKVKESTFVFTHLYNRIGQLMKKLTKKKAGYGLWGMPLESIIGENKEEI